ncbi:MAG: hypothetical protein ACO280_12415, partial [Pseudohongiellaceae bacterium]
MTTKDIYLDADDLELEELQDADEDSSTTRQGRGKELAVTDTMVPGHDLGAYVTAVNRFAILSAEEERKLANRYFYQQG